MVAVDYIHVFTSGLVLYLADNLIPGVDPYGTPSVTKIKSLFSGLGHIFPRGFKNARPYIPGDLRTRALIFPGL